MLKLTKSEQARINGARSRGPITAEGKRRSSMNALKTGKFAKNAAVLSTEDASAFDEHLQDYIRRFKPECPVVMRLVHELASIDWRLARNLAMATNHIENEMEVQAPALRLAGANPSHLKRTTVAAASAVDRSSFSEFLSRSETRLIYARDSTLRALRQIRTGYSLTTPSNEILSPQPLDPDFEPRNEPKTSLNEPKTNPSEPAMNQDEPKAA